MLNLRFKFILSLFTCVQWYIDQIYFIECLTFSLFYIKNFIAKIICSIEWTMRMSEPTKKDQKPKKSAKRSVRLSEEKHASSKESSKESYQRHFSLTKPYPRPALNILWLNFSGLKTLAGKFTLVIQISFAVEGESVCN